ncbi:MAG TPA: LysM peptidoglycan-binding domain-containing protein, partial [Roseateles sp.]
SYDYRDSALQKSIFTTMANQNTSITLNYDANGYLSSRSDTGTGQTTSYVNNANGQVLQSTAPTSDASRPVTRNFFYANGERIGDVGNSLADRQRITYDEQLSRNGSSESAAARTTRESSVGPLPYAGAGADFDQNFEPINDNSPSNAAASYTVRRRGETLRSVAQALWGDASLWYLLAEANGLQDNAVLYAGQVLRVPNKVTNIHNNAETSRPYNPAEAMGATGTHWTQANTDAISSFYANFDSMIRGFIAQGMAAAGRISATSYYQGAPDYNAQALQQEMQNKSDRARAAEHEQWQTEEKAKDLQREGQQAINSENVNWQKDVLDRMSRNSVLAGTVQAATAAATAANNRSLLNQAEMAADPGRYTSMTGPVQVRDMDWRGTATTAVGGASAAATGPGAPIRVNGLTFSETMAQAKGHPSFSEWLSTVGSGGAGVDARPGSVYVQPGDSLTKIGARFPEYGNANDLKNQLIAVNPQLPDPNKLTVGMRLNFPDAGTVVDSAAMSRAVGADERYQTALASRLQDYWDSLQVGAWSGRTGEGGPMWHVGAQPTASAGNRVGLDGRFETAASWDIAGGGVTGGTEQVSEAPSSIGYGEEMLHLAKVALGFGEGLFDGVPKFAVGVGKLLWQGAQMQGLRDGGVAPHLAYQIATQSTENWWSGELFSYNSVEERIGGFGGEFFSPFVYGKAVQLTIGG